VVGTHRAGSETHAFSWTQYGGMVDLDTLGGNYSVALAVSPSGQVVGESTTDSGDYHAFSWMRAGGMRDLPSLAAGIDRAVAVSPSGQVVGYGYVTSTELHAVLWKAS
jgi:probable HAF family extracellular repeat protein